MKAFILLSLLVTARAHAALTIQGVSWPGEGVIKVLVASNGGEPTAIEVPLAGTGEATRTTGLYTATVHAYPSTKAGESPLLTILLSQQGGEMGSLYVLRQTANGQYEYANKKPIQGEAPAMGGDLANIFSGLRHFNGCTDVGALEALVQYKTAWPESEIIQFKNEVEKASIPKGEDGVCAVIKGPKPKPAATPTTSVAPAAPKPPAAPRRRAPRPAQPADPYGGYGRGGYGDGGYGGYGSGYGGYGSGGGYGGGYGSGGYGY